MLQLKLSDSSITFEPETSQALGFGFRCGFLGLLHMEIIEERIEREFGIDLIATSPSVVYEVEMTDRSMVYVDSPAKMPERQKIKEIKEPYIKTNVFVPSEYIGPIMELCQNKRGIYGRKILSRFGSCPGAGRKAVEKGVSRYIVYSLKHAWCITEVDGLVFSMRLHIDAAKHIHFTLMGINNTDEKKEFYLASFMEAMLRYNEFEKFWDRLTKYAATSPPIIPP